MTDQNLIKTKVVSGDRKFHEFESGDTVAVTQGGTGGITAAAARNNLGVPAVGDVITDHGALSGLGDDDHNQYHNDARGDARYFQQSQVTTLLSSKADLVGGLIPSSQLPAFVDDVLEFSNLAGFPVTGEVGKIYIALDTNIQYRWSGTAYIDLTQSSGGGLPFFDSIQSDVPLASQSTTLFDYLSLNTVIPELGDYEVEWSLIWSVNTTGSDWRGQVLVDGALVGEYSIEPQDSGGGGQIVSRVDAGGTLNTGTNQRFPLSGKWLLNNQSAGALPIQLQFGNTTAGTEAAIYRAHISVRRVA